MDRPLCLWPLILSGIGAVRRLKNGEVSVPVFPPRTAAAPLGPVPGSPLGQW
jgi:hypothetical protein